MTPAHEHGRRDHRALVTGGASFIGWASETCLEIGLQSKIYRASRSPGRTNVPTLDGLTTYHSTKALGRERAIVGKGPETWKSDSDAN